MIVQAGRRRARATMMLLALMMGLAFAGRSWADPMLWKVSGPTATVYLFGTVHVLKPGVAWRTPKIDAALKSASALWLEVPNADDPATMQPLIATYGIDAAHPLATKLDPDTLAKLNAFLEGLGVNPAQMQTLRPWMVGVAVDTLPLMKAGYDLNSGVEHVIKTETISAGKPVEGFETAEEQIRYLADVPLPTEIAFLKSSLAEGEKSVSILDALVEAWSRGDEAKLESLLNEDLKESYPDLYQRLIVDRNRRFAEKIAALAKGEGVVFVAVGAAHLLGPDSVQADLEKLGVPAVRQ